MDKLVNVLQSEISNLKNQVSTMEIKKQFLRQQIFEQFYNTEDYKLCRSLFGDPTDSFDADNSRAKNAILTHLKAAQEISSHIYKIKSTTIERADTDNDVRKVWLIEGTVSKDLDYILEFFTEFKVIEKETKEYVKGIRRLEFNPTCPVLESMSAALKKEHSIETLISSLYMFCIKKGDQNNTLNELNSYNEVQLEKYKDGSTGVKVLLTDTMYFYIILDLTYNPYCCNFFHKIFVNADEEILQRYSQHKNFNILNGEQMLDFDDIFNFIESMFAGMTDDEQ